MHSRTRQRTARMASHRRAQEHRLGAGGSPIMIPKRRLVPMALRRRRRQHRQRLRLGECQLIRRASQRLVWPVPALHQVGHLECYVATPDPMARIGRRRAGWTAAEGAGAINKVIVPDAFTKPARSPWLLFAYDAAAKLWRPLHSWRKSLPCIWEVIEFGSVCLSIWRIRTMPAASAPGDRSNRLFPMTAREHDPGTAPAIHAADAQPFQPQSSASPTV